MAKRGENIYKRKDGRYEGRYIRGRNEEGKAMFGYIYSYSYSEVKIALTLAKASAHQDTPLRIIGKGHLLEFLQYWLENIVKERVKQSTFAQYHERIYNHIVPALGHFPVCCLTKEQVQCFVGNLSKNGLASSTVRNIAVLLCSAMKKAAALHLTQRNPCEDLELPQIETKERRTLDRTEQVTLERSLPHSDRGTELGIFLALYAGVRIGEALALPWDCVKIELKIFSRKKQGSSYNALLAFSYFYADCVKTAC